MGLIIILNDILNRWNIEVKDELFYVEAFTHSSYFNENKDKNIKSYERLEYLGDSLLGMVISEYLYKKFPNSNEGELSKMRSCLSNFYIMGEIIVELELNEWIYMGKGQVSNDQGNKKILGDVFESFIGAIYLDHGIHIMKKIVLDLYAPYFNRIQIENITDYKTKIQEKCHVVFGITPSYILEKERMTKNGKLFGIGLWIGDRKLSFAQEFSKKKAEFICAKLAYNKLLYEYKEFYE